MKKNLSIGKKPEDFEVLISAPSSASSVLHVSHTDGSSVSTIVRDLEARLHEATPPPSRNTKKDSKEGSAQFDAEPPASPSPGNSRELRKSGVKLMAKLGKKSGQQQPAEFVMSSPSNFQHNMHVDSELNWGTDPEKVLKQGAVLGQGAYGQVVQAQYINTNYVMALKLIPLITAGKGVEDVSREINVLRRCRHPNIVSYYGSATTPSELWIMMEYCMHGSLASIIDVFAGVEKQLTEKQLAHVLHQALTGLSYLHNDQIKVIHRDLKCGNILVGEDGAVKLADFGISFQQTGSRSKAATLIGTPLFMSPEMLSGDPYNAKADIWSLGITAIEMADGVPPYVKDHQMRALFRIMHEDPPTLAEPHKWSPQFVSFIGACLKKEPNERPTAAALLEHEFLRQMKAEETKAVMKNLLHQYEDARRELRKRKLGDKCADAACLNFNAGGGGNFTTLSTETSSAFVGGKSSASGLTTLSSDASAAVVQLRSSNSAPTLGAHLHADPANGGALSAPADVTPAQTGLTSEEEYIDDERSLSDDEDDEDEEVAAVSVAAVNNKAVGAGGDGGKSSSTESADEEVAASAESKKSKRKSKKSSKKKKSKKSTDSLGRKRSASSTPGVTPVPAKDRRATLAQMHSGQSSMAFFTGLSRGAQQLLSGAPQAPAPPPPGVGTDGLDTEPHTIEEHLRNEAEPAAQPAEPEPASPPRTMAELAAVVENVDEYLGMPLVQLIYELHSVKKKHDLLADQLKNANVGV